MRMIKFQTPPDQYDTMNYIDPNFPDGSVANAKNYCRNPDGTGLHCYKSGNVRGDCASLIEPCGNWGNCINSLTPGRCFSNFQSKLFKTLQNNSSGTRCEIARRSHGESHRIPLNWNQDCFRLWLNAVELPEPMLTQIYLAIWPSWATVI